MLGLPIVLAIGALVVLAALLPLFVALISSRIRALLEETKQQAIAVKALRDSVERNTKLLESHGTEVADQLEVNNTLMRQLLRAYGHEPEV